ncbi:hypothetical protein [Pseudomonas sp. AL03]|uniref:hypothetical protein n=1 Tax=Pseudomonas sp. AL03 TaxID=3042230 RepID=UPI00249C7C8C|nr:hypothetical protein [Pseudomonas sp. AL03]MDI3274892.1 hypothetical protein [Pseudomonas sp. AL03]
MSTKTLLVHKILAHLERKDRAEKRQAQQVELFETSASELYSKIGEMLAGIHGVELSTQAPILPEPASRIETLYVKVLDKTVTFDPAEQNEERGLAVSGLFDRAMFFTPLHSGDWEAEDQRSNTTILLTEKVIFTRLAAIVPD